MDIWDEIKKLTGYQSGNGRVDSYGVDHSGFSLRDELEYQSARLARENQLAKNFSKQGIAEENYPQFGTNFWGGSPENNYGFGSSNISQNIENVTNQLNNGANSGQGLVNPDYTINTESLVGQPSSYFQNNNYVSGMNNSVVNQAQNNIQPRYWENAMDGKKVYKDVVKQEGNFVPPNQNLFDYTKSAIQGGMNIVGNFSNMKKMNVTDKYKHAMMNCNAAQYGQGGADIATLASNLREWNDKRTGSNTLDSSEGDQYANRIGRLLGGKYPKEDCDELIRRYIKKNW
ncbi:MAG: hypothetical protein IJ677_08080 [Alphaproteobacteria bacterium]|nr:hypothetical protein [Alphaproteobacteria bacterium]